MHRAMGVDAALARISQLEARFAAFAPTRPATTATPTAGSPATAAGTTFSEALAAVSGPTSATATAALTPARRLPAGRYGTLSPPAELAGYGNGRIPPGRLAPLGVGDGVASGVKDSYRDLAGQQAVAREKGLYSQGGLAATPGTSNHGWGVALDLELDGRGQQWMRDNGWRYGYVEDVAREPWHWTYRPDQSPS
jgi:D-alanyl-D-alanine carboxypeptidase